MNNKELIEFLKQKTKRVRKINREPWYELVDAIERLESIENSKAKRVRKLGLSQNDLAEIYGIKPCTVSSYLSGKRKAPQWFEDSIDRLFKSNGERL